MLEFFSFPNILNLTLLTKYGTLYTLAYLINLLQLNTEK